MTITKLTLGPIAVNCYILKYSENKAVIIDPGDEGEEIAAELTRQRLTPDKIFLTHGHFDHMGAAAFLKEKYGVPVYINEKDSVMLNDSRRIFKRRGYNKAGGILTEGNGNSRSQRGKHMLYRR